MPWSLDVALTEDRVVAERRLRLPASGLERIVQLRRFSDDAHSPAAPAGCRLHDKRKADLVGLALRNDRHTGLLRLLLRFQFVTPSPQSLGRGPDEEDPRSLDGLCAV